MKIGNSNLGLEIPFNRSINDVVVSGEELRRLPSRTRLNPVSGNRINSKLVEVFRPRSMQEQHLESILSPPTLGSDQMSFGQFKKCLVSATLQLRSKSNLNSIAIDNAVRVLDDIEKDRSLLDIEFSRLLDA